MEKNLNNRDTIYALSTPFARSGIAVIRLSGPHAKEVFQKLTGLKTLKSRYAYLTKIRDYVNSEIIDEGLGLFFEGPNSFTGEDVVELQVHGSKAVINIMLEMLAKIRGLRPAEPGEFSKRAFYNNKMDLTQMEGLADLIDAETKLQQKQAIRQMQGFLGKIYDRWRIIIIQTLALVEAFIDFPDEEIPADIINDIDANIAMLTREVAKHLDDNFIGEKLKNGIKVAIIGEPNVGKSTLLNCLAKRDIAIISDIPGTTRDAIEVAIDLAGFEFILTDTAGIRESEDPIEKIGINVAYNKLENADLVIELYDVHNFKTQVIKHDKPCIKVINKVDIRDINNDEYLTISAKDQINIDLLLSKLEEFAQANFALPENPVITRTRYRNHLNEALINLNNFSINKPIELAAEDLRSAAFEIGKITGHISVDDILDYIFSSFCIGK